MANSCINEHIVQPVLRNATSWRMSDANMEQFSKQMEELVGQAKAAGMSLDTPIKNAKGETVTLAQGMVDDLLLAEARRMGDRRTADALKVFKHGALMDRINSVVAERTQVLADKGKKPLNIAQQVGLKLQALRDLISTGERSTTREPSLELRMSSKLGENFGMRFLKEIDDKIPGVDAQKLLADPAFMGDVMREFFNRDPAKRVTQTANAKEFADIMYGALNRIREDINFHGGNMSPSANLFSPRLEWRKIEAGGRDAFVQKMRKWLSPRYGDDAVRGDLAAKMYDELDSTRGLMDWDNIGLKDLDAGSPLLSKGAGEEASRHIEFVDGDAWHAFNSDYGNINFGDMVFRRFEYLSRKHAALEVFGANYSSKFGNTILDDLLEEITGGKSEYMNSKPVSRIRYDYEKLTTFAGTQDPVLSGLLGGLRSWTVAAKLGSSILSNLLDVPSMVASAKALYGSDMWQAVQIALAKFPGAEKRDYARHLGIALDSFNNMGGSQYRFTADPLMSGALGDSRLERGVSAWQNSGAYAAEKVMKFGGMAFWQDSGRVAAGRLAGAMMHDHIANERTWEQLPRGYRNSLERNGITADDWDNIIEGQWSNFEKPIHDAGSQLEGLVDVSKFDTEHLSAQGALSPRERIMAVLQDQANHMVLQPGLRDRATMSFYAEPGSWQEQVYKTLTMFLSFSETFSRRIIGSIIAGSDAPASFKLAQAGGIIGALIATNFMVVQLKQAAAGKPFYDPTDTSYWAESVFTAGGLGIFTDWMKQAGLDEIFKAGFHSLFGEGKYKAQPHVSDATQFLGAGFGGVAKVGAGFISLATAWASNDHRKLDTAARNLLNSTFAELPGQNLIWGRIVLRDLLFDGILDFVDHRGYTDAKRRAERRERQGRVDPTNPLLNIAPNLSHDLRDWRTSTFGY